MNNIEKTMLLIGTTVALTGCLSGELADDASPVIEDPVIEKPVVDGNIKLDFEGDTTSYALVGDTNGSAMVEQGPLDATNEALKVVATAGYASGVAMPVTIPTGKTLADYSSVSFKVYYTAEGSADTAAKRIQILAASGELPGSVSLIQWNGSWAENATDAHLGVMDNAKADQLESTAFQTYTFDLTDGNVADLDAGSDSSLATSTKALTGDISLIVGFPHADSTYYIDDLELVLADATTTPEAGASIVADFESGSSASSLIGDGEGSALVVADPTDDTKKSLKVSIVTENAGYGAGVAIPMTIPAGKTLADYASASFDVYYTAEGVADIDNKRIQLLAYGEKPTSIPVIQWNGSWVDDATEAHLGVMDNAKADKTASTAFQTYTFDLTDGNVAALDADSAQVADVSLADATKALTGDIYLVVAFPHNSSVYYIDNLTLVVPE